MILPNEKTSVRYPQKLGCPEGPGREAENVVVSLAGEVGSTPKP